SLTASSSRRSASLSISWGNPGRRSPKPSPGWGNARRRSPRPSPSWRNAGRRSPKPSPGWGNARRRSPKPSPRLLEPEQEVRASRLEAREIDGHVDVAERAELAHERRVAIVLPEPRHLIGGQLEAREAIVVADAKLAEAERTHD